MPFSVDVRSTSSVGFQPPALLLVINPVLMLPVGNGFILETIVFFLSNGRSLLFHSTDSENLHSGLSQPGGIEARQIIIIDTMFFAGSIPMLDFIA